MWPPYHAVFHTVMWQTATHDTHKRIGDQASALTSVWKFKQKKLSRKNVKRNTSRYAAFSLRTAYRVVFSIYDDVTLSYCAGCQYRGMIHTVSYHLDRSAKFYNTKNHHLRPTHVPYALSPFSISATPQNPTYSSQRETLRWRQKGAFPGMQISRLRGIPGS